MAGDLLHQLAEVKATLAAEREKVARCHEALRWIEDQEPATAEMTLAHQMAQHARAVLRETGGADE